MIFTVAIDGPAAAGKGTVSKGIAAHFGFAHLDTGLLYRATGARTLEGLDPVAAAKALVPGDLQRDDLRTPAVAQAASKIAVLLEVRAQLVEFQRSFARRAGGAVLDGRDIGTVICPDADVKLFVTASEDVRAKRRHEELTGNGLDISIAAVRADIAERDARDRNRDAAPTLQASDAVLIDTSHLTAEESLSAAIEIVQRELKRRL